ncbi:SNF1 protein kinase subunit beta-2 [Psilocybe cubensis]|uniref:SNF1 protein kinase subunit beta-2 n=2 Tax=Psilocybe cubensis TaxID=181762 RepID=A0ACB8GZC6_PSICU|nr:SNF1 protein kinase subunit beta-2 [Psilocybe cubensis]KAH9480732.1 SNF1 protein kinase subunit beta-2 [Psilocybe cubensis]
MGNSASNANNPPRNPPAQTSMRQTSTSPGPGNPHPSMRTKKRSLELPDLASLSLTPASNNGSNRGRQTKSASIPIPPAPQNNNYPFNHYITSQDVETEQRTSVQLPSTSDMLQQTTGYGNYRGGLQPPSTHQPFPPPPAPRGRTAGYYQSQNESRHNQSAPRGRQQAIPNKHHEQIMRIQELYDKSQQTPSAPPSSPAGPSSMPSIGSGYPREVVRSSIPVLLGKAAKAAAEVEQSAALSPLKEDLLADPVPVKIVWMGGGREVVLARAGDDEWKGRQPMERDPINPNVFTLTVHLRPGTHHVRFLVDGQWRVADDLPSAVDDQGSLANYVAVPLTYGLPGQTQPPVFTTAPTNTIQITMPPPQFASVQPPKKVQPGQSFWSADSSADGEDERRPSSSSGTAGNKGQADAAKNPAAAAAAAYIQAPWTDVFPPELLEAAREEEAYLAASAGQYDASGNTARVSGFVPAPNIPPAPGLPRHLDKLILNSRVGEQKRNGGDGSVNGSAHGHGHRGDRGDHGHRDGGGSGVGSGQGSAARRERRERERERERERGTRSSRRGTVPPPPPPSEDGGDYEPPAITVPTSTPASSTVQLPSTSSSSVPPAPASGSASGTTTPSNAAQASSTVNALASTSAGTISGASAGSGGVESTGTTTAATSPQASLPATPTGQMSPMQTPPKGVGWAAGGVAALPPSVLLAGFPQPGLQSSSAAPMPSSTTQSPSPQPPTLERAAVSGSRAITIDDANMPALTDDNSVLPVPSHVVLHHLCTSAIKNGVLAVANTTRYRKKYLTTIYYKPT